MGFGRLSGRFQVAKWGRSGYVKGLIGTVATCLGQKSCELGMTFGVERRS